SIVTILVKAQGGAFGRRVSRFERTAGNADQSAAVERRVFDCCLSLLCLLPGAHAVGHTLVEVERAHGSLYACQPHPLAYFVAHTGEGECDTLALQFFYRVQ